MFRQIVASVVLVCVLCAGVVAAEATPDADGKPIKHIGQIGHIALQQHDPGSTPQFKNIKVKEV